MGHYGWLIAAFVSVTALAAGLLLMARRRITPEEKERRRRQFVNQRGRITDAVITEVRVVDNPSGAASHWILYSYDLRGVGYTAAQDITSLLAHISRDPRTIAGPASVKYLPDNPFNSIVICERWSGFR